jgi:hypothetical protein
MLKKIVHLVCGRADRAEVNAIVAKKLYRVSASASGAVLTAAVEHSTIAMVRLRNGCMNENKQI